MSIYLAVTVFVVAITASVFGVWLFFPRLHDNDFTNFLIRRGLLAIGFYLLAWNSGLMYVMVQDATLNLPREMLTYMVIFGRAGWVVLIFLIFESIVRIPKEWRKALMKKRMGLDVGNE